MSAESFGRQLGTAWRRSTPATRLLFGAGVVLLLSMCSMSERAQVVPPAPPPDPAIAAKATADKERLRAHERRVSDALHKCQQLILATAQYGDANRPPPTSNHGKDDEFYFAWPKGSFEFTNGFGAKVRMSASCMGSIATGAVTSLTINGKQII